MQTGELLNQVSKFMRRLRENGVEFEFLNYQMVGKKNNVICATFAPAQKKENGDVNQSTIPEQQNNIFEELTMIIRELARIYAIEKWNENNANNLLSLAEGGAVPNNLRILDNDTNTLEFGFVDGIAVYQLRRVKPLFHVRLAKGRASDLYKILGIRQDNISVNFEKTFLQKKSESNIGLH